MPEEDKKDFGFQWMNQMLIDFENEFRTHEIHGGGAIAKWFTNLKIDISKNPVENIKQSSISKLIHYHNVYFKSLEGFSKKIGCLNDEYSSNNGEKSLPKYSFITSNIFSNCHRRCCICHKFCGVKMEINHINPKGNNGSDNIENAIPLCFECHAEVGRYNPRHPKGKKYSVEELKLHREQWIDICKNSPQVFSAIPDRDVGPLEGILAELEYNLQVALRAEGSFPQKRIGAPLKLAQYERAIIEGSLMLLPDDVKIKVTEAYVTMGRAQSFNETRISVGPIGDAYSKAEDSLFSSLQDSVKIIEEALTKLKFFLK